jgi:putative ABC transport system permease protein
MRPALRLAWREVARHRVRSLLVLVLIGLPILASVSAVTVIETADISSKEAQATTFGAAQYRVEWNPYSYDESSGETQTRQISGPDAAARLRAATSLPVLPVTWQAEWLGDQEAGWTVQALRTDLGSPLAAGLADLVRGRLPRSGAEITVSPRLEHQGASLGHRLTLDGTSVTVVGIARSFSDGNLVEDAVFVGSSQPAAETSTPAPPADPTQHWAFLVGGQSDPPLTDADRQRIQEAGFESYRPGEVQSYDGLAPTSQDLSLISLLITCLLIEIVLLAGPAFAVGVRRQRHSLALLAVAGGTPSDIRRTVMAQGLILGLVASVLGAALSIPLTWLGLTVVERGLGLTLGPFDLGGIAIAPAIVLGTLSALLACVVPARQASRADVVTALAGRQPAPRVRRGWPIAGAVVLAIGTVGSLASLNRFSGDLANAWWAVVSVCGAVMLTPWLIATIARLAPKLGLPARIALRDADRHRSRSAPAVAAVMASVAAVVALGIGGASDDRENQQAYNAGFPEGTTTLSTSPATMTAVIAAVKERTGVVFTPMTVLQVAAEPADDARGSDLGEGRVIYASRVVVADAATLEAWGVPVTAQARDALASGRALADPSLLGRDSELTLNSWEDQPVGRVTKVAAVKTDLAMAGEVPTGAPRAVVAGLVIPPATAAALHLLDAGQDLSVEAIADHTAKKLSISRIEAAARQVAPGDVTIDVASASRSHYWLILLLLGCLGAFTVLLGTFSATGLALDDAKADLNTLSAVGARPVTRRAVSGAHAFLIAFLGAVLGIAVGFTPGIAASWLLTANYGGSGWVFVVPWQLLGILVVVLPLVAGLLTAAVSRTRATTVRRQA